jgi:hypothetical protein
MDPVFVYASDNAGQKALAQTAAPTFLSCTLANYAPCSLTVFFAFKKIQ